jgi:hypothetical protein
MFYPPGSSSLSFFRPDWSAAYAGSGQLNESSEGFGIAPKSVVEGHAYDRIHP